MCILYDTEIVRLIGVHEDERDLYYRVRGMRPRGEFLSTAVGHIVSLRGIYPPERYEYMDRVFSLNGAHKSDQFLVTNAIDGAAHANVSWTVP